MSTLSRQVNDAGIAVLTLDRPDSSANVFDPVALEELREQLEALAQPTQEIRGLILRSAKRAIFHAGGDLDTLVQLGPEQRAPFIELGQQVFARLAALPFPTVAAIHGACVGGGLELALACDWRVATPAHATRFGLPEVHLGILPCWGGAMRLPRLLGLAPALELLASGELIPSQRAAELGLVDRLAPEPHLLTVALELLASGKRPLTRLGLAQRATAGLAESAARSEVLRRVGPLYPAPLRAIATAVGAAGAEHEREAHALERQAALELAETPAAAHLLRLYIQRERARKIAVPGAPENLAPIRHVVVLGSGGAALPVIERLITHGRTVVLQEPDAATLAHSLALVHRHLQEHVASHRLTQVEAERAYDRLAPTLELPPLQRAELVLDFTPAPDFATARASVERLERLAAPGALVATTAPTFPLGELLAEPAPTGRCVTLHFHAPSPLVEVAGSAATSPEALQRALALVQELGCVPVLTRAEPGLLVHRVLLPYVQAAEALAAQGVPARAIAEAARAFGFTEDPLALRTKLALRDLPAQPPAVAEVPAGKRAKLKLTSAEITERLLNPLLNAARQAAADAIVETPAELDLALTLAGTFPAARGGPLAYASALPSS